MRVTTSLATVVALLGTAAPGPAQEPAPGDTLPVVLPADHPLRPQAPYEPGPSVVRLLFKPFEFLGTGAEGTLVWYEKETGGFAAGLAARASRARDPSHVSIGGGSLGTRSGFIGAQVHVHDARLDSRGPRYGVTAGFTHRLYQTYTAYLGVNDPLRHPYALLTGFYDIDTMNEYWGLGPDSDDGDESGFSWERWGARASAGLPEEGMFRVRLRGSYERSFFFRGDQTDNPDAVELFPEASLPQQELGSVGGLIGIDLRDAPGHPTRGVFAAVDGDLYRSLDDAQDFDWTRWGAEAQAHVPLGTDWYILSLGARVDEVEPDEDDGTVPFPYLPALGGSSSLRGYDSWRWRDFAAATGTAEFRWRVWQEQVHENPEQASAIEATLFYDVGQVGPTIDDLETDDLKTAYGFLFRMFLVDRHVASVGVGRSEEGTRFAFSTSGYW